MTEQEQNERKAPVVLRQGEHLLWHGVPAAPPRIPARPAYTVVTLSSAFGFWAYWMMVPELPFLRVALLIPILAFLAMAAYPPLTARRRAKVFYNSARYTLTNQRAVSAHAEKTIEVALSASSKIHLSTGELQHLILWNTGGGTPSQPVYFHQLENGEEPYKIAQSLLDTPI